MYRMLRSTDRVEDRALHSLKLQVNDWNIKNFILHFYITEPLFSVKSKEDFDSMYYLVESSRPIQKLLELLFFQFKRTTYVREFLYECVTR